ncbi:Uncharacterised protein [[Clostridium] innocuum]|uniref:Uncharacterized protein n=1 Tax=Clostridium innocuum TaxID=1522 RepID=A0A6N2WR79_CLOIN
MSRIQFLSGHDRTGFICRPFRNIFRSRIPLPVAYIFVRFHVLDLEGRSCQCNGLIGFLIDFDRFDHRTEFFIIEDTPWLRITTVFRYRYLEIRYSIMIIRDFGLADYIHTIRKFIRNSISILVCHQDSSSLTLCVFRNWRFLPRTVFIDIFLSFYCKFNTGQLIRFSGSVIRDFNNTESLRFYPFFYRLFLCNDFHTLTCIVKRDIIFRRIQCVTGTWRLFLQDVFT